MTSLIAEIELRPGAFPMLVLLYLPVLLASVLVVFYAERKLSAFIQDRMGPTETGPFGLLQAFADLLKLLQKEDIIPTQADKTLFLIASPLIFALIFGGLAVIPLTATVQASEAETGVFYLMSITALDVAGILMAGWAANSKFSMLGAMRSTAQVVSYEVPLGLTVVTGVLLCGSLNLQEIAFQQGIWFMKPQFLFGIKALGIEIGSVGGFLAWNVVRMPLFFVVYLIYYLATLAECNRAPFDLPEGESELVGGFHTEFSGFRWSLFFLSEYALMLLLAAVGVILFLGGWNTPFPNVGPLKMANWTSGSPGSWFGLFTAAFWLGSKTILVVFTQIWVRWTFPRLRTDQLLYLCWKVLTPFALVMLLITACWKLLAII